MPSWSTIYVARARALDGLDRCRDYLVLIDRMLRSGELTRSEYEEREREMQRNMRAWRDILADLDVQEGMTT